MSISAEVFDYVRASHSGSSSLNSSVSFSSDERPVQRVIKLSGVMQDVTRLHERVLAGVQDSEKLRQREDDVKIVIETIPQLVWTSDVSVGSHVSHFTVLAIENSHDKLRSIFSLLDMNIILIDSVAAEWFCLVLQQAVVHVHGSRTQLRARSRLGDFSAPRGPRTTHASVAPRSRDWLHVRSAR